MNCVRLEKNKERISSMRRLWFNGSVYTMNREMQHYEAIGVENEQIVFVGCDKEALQEEWDEKTNLMGNMLLPGFNDTHMHLLNYALFQKDVSLFGTKSIQEVISLCLERIEINQPNYLLGIGWDQENLLEKRMPTKEDMNRISTEIPVCIIRSCFHIAVCNTVMLDKIRKTVPKEDNALQFVDFENGILREDAMRLYRKVIPDVKNSDIREMMLKAQRDLNAAGITCVHSDDLKVIPGVDPVQLIRIIKKMDDDGELTVRIYEQCLVDDEELREIVQIRDDINNSNNENLFRIGPRKILQDGSLGAQSAELIDGYSDSKDNKGIAIHTEEELYHLIKEAHVKRMDVAVHTIGDLALTKLCDAIEKILNEDPWEEHRHAAVHAQITTPKLLSRMKELGIQALVQPIFIEGDMEVIEERVGFEHAKTCYNWKSMIDEGIYISGGSDCPVEPFDILDNMRSAITRQNREGTMVYLPEQALSIEEAIRLFTSSAAWASRDEDCRGMLEIGKIADLVVLDKNLFEIPPQQFSSVNILETVLDGKTVYRKN